MYYHVKKGRPLDGTRLWLEFEDGKQGVYDMAPIMDEGVFAKLKDPTLFGAACSDGFTVVWPCGLDIAPEELYEHCTEHRPATPQAQR